VRQISADCQAETHALDRLIEATISLHEWVEDALQFFGRNARSRI